MGVERSVTRWYLQRQLILYEIALLEAQLAPPSAPSADAEPAVAGTEQTNDASVDLQQVELQLAKAREKLKALGLCPKPMMG